MLSDRIGGLISIVFGGISVSEAIRLYPERVSTFVGDYLLPGVVGAGLILLGLLMLFAKGERFKVEFPESKIMRGMLLVVGIMFVYWILLQFLGYTLSTFVVSIALFRVIGSYNLLRSAIYSTIQVAVIYLIFVYWLRMPFPEGILNFLG